MTSIVMIKLKNSFPETSSSDIPPYDIHFTHCKGGICGEENILKLQESTGGTGTPPDIDFSNKDTICIWAQTDKKEFKKCPLIIPMPQGTNEIEFPFSIEYREVGIPNGTSSPTRYNWILRLDPNVNVGKSTPQNININVGDDKQ